MGNNNNMVCDLQTGVCGVAEEEEMENIDFNQPTKAVNLYYVTDPICSHCWALEPVLRRFVEQYGNFLTSIRLWAVCWKNGMMDQSIRQTAFINQPMWPLTGEKLESIQECQLMGL